MRTDNLRHCLQSTKDLRGRVLVLKHDHECDFLPDRSIAQALHPNFRFREFKSYFRAERKKFRPVPTGFLRQATLTQTPSTCWRAGGSGTYFASQGPGGRPVRNTGAGSMTSQTQEKYKVSTTFGITS